MRAYSTSTITATASARKRPRSKVHAPVIVTEPETGTVFSSALQDSAMITFIVLLAIWGWCLAGYMILAIHSTSTYSETASYADSFKLVKTHLFSADPKVGYMLTIMMSPLALLVTILIHFVDATNHAREQKRLAQDQRDEDARVLRDAKMQFKLGYEAGSRAARATEGEGAGR